MQHRAAANTQQCTTVITTDLYKYSLTYQTNQWHHSIWCQKPRRCYFGWKKLAD